MNDINQIISKLRLLYEKENEARRKIAASQSSDVNDDEFHNKIIERYRDDISWARKNIHETLEIYQNFPPSHIRHFDKLKEFENDGNFNKSVFIMTKFPNESEIADIELKRIIDITRQAIKDCNHVSRIATDKAYHPMLWDNVELYLLGCKKGIAIVEDRYKRELNPNVALEWGWMKGMGKDVLFLVEKQFNHERADWSGYLKNEFDWNHPEVSIKTAIKKWLMN